MAHLCGLCLTLRDEHGQLARLATNVDGLLLSLLVEAQAPASGRYRVAGRCPLRHMRPATVVASTEPGARYAAAVSLVAAASQLRDHAADGDGPLRHKPVAALAHRVAGRFAMAGDRSARTVGFDTHVLTAAVDRARDRERAARPGSSVLAITEPTENAAAAAFAHTAVLADCPQNLELLSEAGRLFGRLVHVLDAATDLAADRAHGSWNLLDATATDLRQAHRLCREALAGLRNAVTRLDLRDGRLVELLLVREIDRVVTRTFATAGNRGRGRENQRRPTYIHRETHIQTEIHDDDCCDECCDCCDDCCCCDDDDDDCC